MKRMMGAAVLVMALEGLAAIPAMTPVSRGDADGWWMKRHAAKVAEAKAGGAPVVFLGGDITWHWTYPDNGKPVWDRYARLGAPKAVNFGVRGDRTEHLLWRCENGELDGYAASCVVVDAGRIGPALNHLLATVVRKQPTAHVMLMPELEKGLSPKDEMAAVYAQVKAFLPKKKP